jgi:hypothetical protein
LPFWTGKELTVGTWNRLILTTGLSLASALAWADDAAACRAHGGAYLTGAVVLGPKFSHGQFRKGIELSHTHLKLRADQDGRLYDVAIDNVFASGYRRDAPVVPPPLDGIRPHDRLDLCGQRYSRGVGIHFVHTNCGQSITPAHPDGWLRVLDARGVPGPNLEGAQQNCRLFGRHR